MKYVDSLVQTYIGLSIKKGDNTVIAESAESTARGPLGMVRIRALVVFISFQNVLHQENAGCDWKLCHLPSQLFQSPSLPLTPPEVTESNGQPSPCLASRNRISANKRRIYRRREKGSDFYWAVWLESSWQLSASICGSDPARVAARLPVDGTANQKSRGAFRAFIRHSHQLSCCWATVPRKALDITYYFNRADTGRQHFIPVGVLAQWWHVSKCQQHSSLENKNDIARRVLKSLKVSAEPNIRAPSASVCSPENPVRN